MKQTVLLFVWLLAAALPVCAQGDRQFVRQGNRLFAQGKYAEAEVSYRKAIGKQPANGVAHYNLGCALQKQQKDSLALTQYEQAAQTLKGNTRRARAYHNMGTVLQHNHDYAKAIEAYKNALRLNPKDEQTRYNYVQCKRLLQQQQQQKNNQKQNQGKNKNKNNKNQQNQQKQQDKQQQDKKRQQQEQMSRQNAEQMLNAAIQQEQQTQQRLKRAMRQPGKKLDKNW